MPNELSYFWISWLDFVPICGAIILFTCFIISIYVQFWLNQLSETFRQELNEFAVDFVTIQSQLQAELHTDPLSTTYHSDAETQTDLSSLFATNVAAQTLSPDYTDHTTQFCPEEGWTAEQETQTVSKTFTTIAVQTAIIISKNLQWPKRRPFALPLHSGIWPIQQLKAIHLADNAHPELLGTFLPRLYYSHQSTQTEERCNEENSTSANDRDSEEESVNSEPPQMPNRPWDYLPYKRKTRSLEARRRRAAKQVLRFQRKYGPSTHPA